jgi:hypothetical protein
MPIEADKQDNAFLMEHNYLLPETEKSQCHTTASAKNISYGTGNS